MIQIYLSMLETEEEKSRFEELYNMHKQDMYAVAFAILNNVHDAEDAVHQAFLRIANNFEKISEIKCPEMKAYTVIIIRNVSIDIYNKNKKASERTIDIEDAFEQPVSDDIYENYDYKKLIEAIKLLPDNLKDALYLRHVSGYSVPETANILGISVDAVSKRLQRAKSMLLEKLDE